MKLGGWHRLWIFLSAVYFIFVTFFVVLEFQKLGTIPHQADIYEKLTKKSVNMINPTSDEDRVALGERITGSITVPNEKPKGKDISTDKLINKAEIDFHPIIEMPNKHVVEFKTKLSEEDMTMESDEYWRIVNQDVNKKRIRLLFYAFFLWVVPCLGLYALGLGVNWVYEGFKQKKNVQQAHPADLE